MYKRAYFTTNLRPRKVLIVFVSIVACGEFAMAQQVQVPQGKVKTVQAPTVQKSQANPKLSQINPNLLKAISGDFKRNYQLSSRTITASFSAGVKKQGDVKVQNATWKCNGKDCTLQTMLIPKISMCRAIVSVQGQSVRSFGDAGMRLQTAQLAECNRATTSMAVTGGIRISVASMVVNQDIEAGTPGPNGVIENLINQFGNDSAAADIDFNNAVGWSEEIRQDGKDPNTWYYVPVEYRLQLVRTGKRPVNVSFTDTYESDNSSEKTVLMTATFAPPTTSGDLDLLEALANSALPSASGQRVVLQPYPVNSVKIHLFDTLSDLGINEEDITVTDTPRNVRDPFSIRVRMNEVAKTTLQSMMRERGGIGGHVIIHYDDEHSAEIPIYMDLRRVSGYPFPQISTIQQKKVISNDSYFPVTMKGIVGYVNTPDGKLVRRYRPLTNEPHFEPRQEEKSLSLTAKQANNFARVFGTNVVHSWFSYESDSDCSDCIAYAERMMESSVDVLRKDTLTIEVPEFVFEQVSIFKVSVQVRSLYFDSSGSIMEVRDHQFRPGDDPATESLFMQRTRSADEPIAEYRFMAYSQNGTKAGWTSWEPIYGTDLTLMSANFTQDGK